MARRKIFLTGLLMEGLSVCVTIARENFVLNDLPSLIGKRSMGSTPGTLFSVVAGLLLMFMGMLAGVAALRESATSDEVAHIGAGVGETGKAHSLPKQPKQASCGEAIRLGL